MKTLKSFVVNTSCLFKTTPPPPPHTHTHTHTLIQINRYILLRLYNRYIVQIEILDFNRNIGVIWK